MFHIFVLGAYLLFLFSRHFKIQLKESERIYLQAFRIAYFLSFIKRVI